MKITRRNSVIIIVIFILCLSITGCSNRTDVIKKIDADDFTISYGNSIYTTKGKVEQRTVDLLVENYNNIKLEMTTNQEINYDKAITIIFIYNDQISGTVTIDDKGVCRVDNNNDNYIINKESDVYVDSLKVYQDLKEEHKLQSS